MSEYKWYGLRRPIQTQYIRRDSVYNPEYLDAQHMLDRFEPLIESVMREMQPWYEQHSGLHDSEDLRSIIQTEFLQLHERYNPMFGVDFPGYLKMYLRARVRYCVSRHHKLVANEVLGFVSGQANGNVIDMIPDYQAARALDSVDCSASIPLELVDDEMYHDIIQSILDDGADIHTLAARYGLSARTMAQKIAAAGEYVREIMEQQEIEIRRLHDPQEEEDEDGEEETE